MDKPNLYEPPVSDLPRGGKNRALWVVFWLLFGLNLAGVFALTAGQDPFSMILMMAYGFVWFALGAFFAKLMWGGRSIDI